MKLHQAKNRMNKQGGMTLTTTCGRSSLRSDDGMNVALSDREVTCKFCLSIMKRRKPTT